MNKTCDILIYAEDPGGANFLAQLPDALSAAGIETDLLAGNLAIRYFKDRDISAQALDQSASAEQLLDDLNPRVVITDTCDNRKSIGLRLIEESRKRGIISVSAVEMAVNADGRFRGEGSTPLEHAPDWLIVPDVITREAYERLGYPGERISVCGHPHYDHVRRKAQQFSSRDPAAFRREVLPLVPANKMVITFVCEPRCALNPALTARSPDYKLLGNSGSDFRGIIVLEELIDALELCSPRPALVVRLHPKNVQSDFAALAPKIDLFSSGGDPLEVVWASDLIVGMSSTLLLEAALLGKPVISIVPRDSDKSLLVSTAVGLTACLSSREQIRQVLSDFVAKQSLPETSMTHSEFFEPGALKRVQEFVSDLLNQSLIEFSDLFEDLNLSITMSEDYQRESSALRD